MPRRKPLVFETAFAQFREQRLIGSGGAGQVYECIDQDGGVWAIKVLAPDRASTEKLKRFKNEYNFSLRHPHVNIVGVTDSGVVDIGGAKMPFFVMPFFPESLRSLLEAKKVSPNDVLALYAHILNGAEAAHLFKVVHRDLKPENILYDPTTKRWMRPRA